jgi:hypothetical protein
MFFRKRTGRINKIILKKVFCRSGLWWVVGCVMSSLAFSSFEIEEIICACCDNETTSLSNICRSCTVKLKRCARLGDKGSVGMLQRSAEVHRSALRDRRVARKDLAKRDSMTEFLSRTASLRRGATEWSTNHLSSSDVQLLEAVLPKRVVDFGEGQDEVDSVTNDLANVAIEARKVRTCTQCGVAGHYVKTCPNGAEPVADADAVLAEADASLAGEGDGDAVLAEADGDAVLAEADESLAGEGEGEGEGNPSN